MVPTRKKLPHPSRKTLCVGGGFSHTQLGSQPGAFPSTLFSNDEDFTFLVESSFSSACRSIIDDTTLELLFIDADGEDLAEMIRFIGDVHDVREKIPIIIFAGRTDDRVRHLLRAGADWHFTKGARTISSLRSSIDKHLFRYPTPPDIVGDVIEEVYTPLLNPYVVGRPLTRSAEALFTGRGEIFPWIGENLFADPHPNALLLYGQRRIGKTSVHYQVVSGKRGLFLRQNNHRSVYPVYIDLQRLAGSPTEEWLLRLAREIYRQAAPYNLIPSLPESRLNGESPYLVLERTLDRLEEALPDKGLILLAIDELEQLRMDQESGHLDPTILPFLRSQIQHRQATAFLFCGSDGLLGNYWSSILNLSAVRELGPLTYVETDSLIRSPLAGLVTYDDRAVECIWRETQGRPYHIQVICHRLVSFLNENHRHDRFITQTDVDHVLSEIRKQNLWSPSFHQ